MKSSPTLMTTSFSNVGLRNGVAGPAAWSAAAAVAILMPRCCAVAREDVDAMEHLIPGRHVTNHAYVCGSRAERYR